MTDTQPYAVIQLAGKQFTISAGDTITSDRVAIEPEKTVEIADVLLYVDGAKRQIGTPLIKGAKVTLKAVNHSKGDKIRVATYKAKSKYRKVKGHRQALTTFEVVSIKA